MFITRKALSRRQMLKGVGATLALPLLDAMVPALTARAAAARPVRRLSLVYVPNGIIMPAWSPTGVGKNYELSRILKPLEPVRDHLLVLSGLSHGFQGSHAITSTAYLTGIVPKRGTGYDAHVTIDQIAARHVGQETPLPSLELGLERPDFAGTCDGGFSCAYVNTVSWRDSTTPLPMETDPRAAFERIFGDGDSTNPRARLVKVQEDRSILDGVMRDAAKLNAALGAGDRQKLTQYLDATRDVERRIQLAEKRSGELPLADIAKPAGEPERFEDYAKLMFDLQVLALQSDTTRVITFMYGKEVSNRSFPEIGVPEPHHATSHHQNDPVSIEQITRINVFHVQLFAYYVDRLRATPDGEGTLLDHATVLYGAGMSDPNTHAHNDLPTLIAGGGGVGRPLGRRVQYPDNTPLTNLWVTLLEGLDVPVERIGDSTGRIDLPPIL